MKFKTDFIEYYFSATKRQMQRLFEELNASPMIARGILLKETVGRDEVLKQYYQFREVKPNEHCHFFTTEQYGLEGEIGRCTIYIDIKGIDRPSEKIRILHNFFSKLKIDLEGKCDTVNYAEQS